MRERAESGDRPKEAPDDISGEQMTIITNHEKPARAVAEDRAVEAPDDVIDDAAADGGVHLLQRASQRERATAPTFAIQAREL